MAAAWIGGSKTPPYSVHSEKALLGGILADPEILDPQGAVEADFDGADVDPDAESVGQRRFQVVVDAALEVAVREGRNHRGCGRDPCDDGPRAARRWADP